MWQRLMKGTMAWICFEKIDDEMGSVLGKTMQVLLWVVIPSIMKQGSVTMVMTVLLIVFLFQYLPKVYHSLCLLRRLQNLSGYIFGTVWWGIALNLIAYFVAAHVSKLYAISRVESGRVGFEEYGGCRVQEHAGTCWEFREQQSA